MKPLNTHGPETASTQNMHHALAQLPALPKLPAAALLRGPDLLDKTPSSGAATPSTPMSSQSYAEFSIPSPAQATRIEKEKKTRDIKSPLAAAFGSLSAGGKLVAAIGATFLGAGITSHKASDFGTGAALTSFGIAAAVYAAANCFGPHAKEIYPQHVNRLKAVAYSGTSLLAAGGLVGQLGIDRKQAPVIGAGWAMSAIGAALISVSFRNFVAMCELNAGRVFTQNRQAAAQALGAIGAGSLTAFATFGHQVEIPGPARSVMHAVMLSAIYGSFALSSSESLRQQVRASGERQSSTPNTPAAKDETLLEFFSTPERSLTMP